jgi:hypothetical protein
MKVSALLPVIMLITASCATSKVFSQLIPEAPEGRYAQGREYIPLQNDSIGVELGYDGRYGEYQVFDFVVINRTSDTISVNPSEFYFVMIEDPGADSSVFPACMAIHPDRILDYYDHQLKEIENEKSVNTILGFIEAGIGLVASATSFTHTNDPAFIADAVFQTLQTAGHYVDADRMIGSGIASVREEQEIVREEIFRQVQLPPGKVTSGFVYFPGNGEGKYLMYCFPVEDQLFQFVYSQQKSGNQEF